MFGKSAMRLAVLALGVSVFTGTAVADSSVPNNQRMKFEFGGSASASWRVVSEDSPLDVNSKAVVVNVPNDGSYWAAYSAKSVNINKRVGNVHNLSFDYARTAPYRVGAGAPRLSVIFANGDVAYLSALYCDNQIAVSGGDWGRADFTGATSDQGTPCAFYVSGATAGPGGLPYTNAPGMSAWDVYVAAHPEQVVNTVFIVTDEPGTYALDRISFGAGKMYQSGKNIAFNCGQNESSC